MNVLSFGYENCKPDKDKISSVMPYSVIHFVVSGEGCFNGNKLSAGQGFIIYENKRAEYYPSSENPWSYAWVRVSGDEVLRSFSTVFSWNTAYSKDVTDISSDDMNGNPMYRLSRLYMLLSYIINDSEKLSAEEKHIRDAENYINSYFDEISSARQVSDRLGLSRAYLRNLFCKYKGVSTKEYIIGKRLEHAANMLISDFPVKLVAISVGYNDQLQFSRIFKKYYGVSPTEYRSIYRDEKHRT